MPDKLKKTIIGAVIAVALAAAVSYGLISQQTADGIQAQANRTLSDGQAAPAPVPGQPAGPGPAPADPAPRNPTGQNPAAPTSQDAAPRR